LIALGAVLAAASVTAAILGLRGASPVARRLAAVAPEERAVRPRWRSVSEADLRDAGVRVAPDRFLALRVACAIAAALLAAVTSLIAPLGPAMVAIGALVGFAIPALVVERRASAGRSSAESHSMAVVERLEALVAAGRPPETALALLLRRPTGTRVLDRVLRRAADAYDLGAPIFRTLSAHARAEGLVTCAAIAEELDRARDLGSGSLSIIRERRGSLRAAQRARTLEAASQVEGKLMLVLVLCYLPALILLVVIPLFMGLLDGLFL
jgi:hypothetical protein